MPLPPPNAQELRQFAGIGMGDTVQVLKDLKGIYNEFIDKLQTLANSGEWQTLEKEERLALAQYELFMRERMWELEAAVTSLSN